MHKLTVALGKIFEGDKWGVAFNSSNGACSFFCEPCEETKPFYGKVFDEAEIGEMIHFLQQTLEEKEGHEQSDLE